MKKNSTYMTRALKSRDPRYAKILGKLGYDRRDIVADSDKEVIDETVQQEFDQAIPNASIQEQFEHQSEEEIKSVRTEYEKVIGKKPYYGWGIDVLRERIDKAKGGN